MKYNAEVVGIREVSKKLRIFKVKPDSPLGDYKAGQYTTLGLAGNEVRVPGAQKEELSKPMAKRIQERAYSISSPIFEEGYELANHNELDYLEFYISLVLTGKEDHSPYLTPRLFMLKEGDRIRIGENISGDCILEDVKKDDNVIFISTGTGLAPHTTMLAELLRNSHEGKIAVIESNGYADDFGYSDQMGEISEAYENVHYEQMITSERENYFMQDLFKDNVLEDKYNFDINESNAKIYLCGSPFMVGAPDLRNGKEIFHI